MKHVPIKMGPIALLLAVISICMTTLGILSYSTAEADLRLAAKYSVTVTDQYEREAQGQEFLAEAAGVFASGGTAADIPSADENDGVTAWKVIEKGSGRLHVGVQSDGNGGLRVVSWRNEAVWEPQSSESGIWIPNFG